MSRLEINELYLGIVPHAGSKSPMGARLVYFSTALAASAMED